MSSSMHPRRRLLGRMVATSALALTGAKISTAQSPTGTMQVLCGAPAGSIPDIVARRFAEQLNGRSAASVIVDNRPGAAGQIAIGALKQAPIDGSSVLLATGAIASVYPYLYSKLAYDPALDLQPVSLAGEMNLGLAVGPAVPDAVTKVAELIDWLRRNPKLANIGSPGVGTLPHLLPALLFQQAKLDWQHIAYPGGPPALANLIGGQISALVLPEGLLRAHQLAGKLRILAT